MKIAIFSDVHGNLQALEAVLNEIKKDVFDEIICLGDVIALGPNPKECLDLIISNNINLILGNHELYYLLGSNIYDKIGEGEIKHQEWVQSKIGDNYKEFLSKCPFKIEKEINNKKYLFEHFILNDNEVYPFEELSIAKNGSIKEVFSTMNYDYVFIGHEHRPFSIELENKKLVDVGSTGCIRDEFTRYTILEINDDSVNIETKNIVYDRNGMIIEMKKENYPNRNFISKIFFGVDLKA